MKKHLAYEPHGRGSAGILLITLDLDNMAPQARSTFRFIYYLAIRDQAKTYSDSQLEAKTVGT